MVKLENDHLKVSIAKKGAEIHSLFHKASGIEHIWQADEKIWSWHAPNLFPVVGQCINDKISVKGISYPMQRHGFARHTEFSVLGSSGAHAVLSISNTAETLAEYPYQFEFQVIYDLIGPKLRISYKVINRQESAVYFALGAHPAFNIPFVKGEAYEDYLIEFKEPAPSHIHLLGEKGLFNGKEASAPIEGSEIHLKHSLFDHDALVFKRIKARALTIKSRKNPHQIKIEFKEFPYLGIWSKGDAAFVCIEPWLGCADSEGPEHEFKEKELIHKLEKGHVFESAFSIEVS